MGREMFPKKKGPWLKIRNKFGVQIRGDNFSEMTFFLKHTEQNLQIWVQKVAWKKKV